MKKSKKLIKRKTKRKVKKKMGLKEIVLDGVKYLKADAIQQAPGDIKIVVLQRGWVLVGKFQQDGTNCKLHNASVIRNWGTTKGLGELAKDGPTSSTKLDPTNGLVEFDVLTVVLQISVNEDKWKSVL